MKLHGLWFLWYLISEENFLHVHESDNKNVKPMAADEERNVENEVQCEESSDDDIPLSNFRRQKYY